MAWACPNLDTWYCNPFGSPASPVPRMKVQGWRVARLKGQSLSGLIQSGGFWRHICSNWSGLMHPIPFRTQNCSKCMINWSKMAHGNLKMGQNGSDGAKWTLGALRCAQREVKVRQDGHKKSPKEPLGTPRGPRMTPKGPQGEPKVRPTGSQGAKVDAQERQNTKKMIVQNH